ncbi:ParA family protein [Moraxella catarrhalis]|uniref:ParA family protein n=1 Tax=Moraxella catarrhalis TaxID=480 RepID=UPI00128E8B85|nr:ParA family protein [Moraxella catarrhalis]MPX18007.1 hypothetical protein [Moraxella catarrhalis]MPY09010.1 ParA family protein [Moraxella catarrhalis]
MKTLVIANQKGGVGKTTIAVHIALQAVKMSKKTLYIDLDVQANSSAFMENSHADAILKVSDLFKTNQQFHFDANAALVLFAADSDFADTNLNLDNWKANITSLSGEFDLCVIDTPPTLGLSQVAPMLVADYVVSPIEPSPFSVQGSANLLTTLSNLQQSYNPNLKFLGLLPSRVNANNNRQLEILAQMRKEYAHLMYPNDMYIPERQAFVDSSYLKIPVWQIREHAAKKVATRVRPILIDIINRVLQ